MQRNGCELLREFPPRYLFFDLMSADRNLQQTNGHTLLFDIGPSIAYLGVCIFIYLRRTLSGIRPVHRSALGRVIGFILFDLTLIRSGNPSGDGER